MKKERRRYARKLICELKGHPVGTLEDLKDILHLHDMCDARALKVIRCRVGKAIGEFCIDVYMDGGHVYALYPC